MAVLQSISAAGLSATTTAVTAAAGGVFGYLTGKRKQTPNVREQGVQAGSGVLVVITTALIQTTTKPTRIPMKPVQTTIIKGIR